MNFSAPVRQRHHARDIARFNVARHNVVQAAKTHFVAPLEVSRHDPTERRNQIAPNRQARLSCERPELKVHAGGKDGADAERMSRLLRKHVKIGFGFPDHPREGRSRHQAIEISRHIVVGIADRNHLVGVEQRR
jgi:hypothetical protein